MTRADLMVRVTVSVKGIPGFSKEPLEMELPPGSTADALVEQVLPSKEGPQGGDKAKSFRNVIVTVNGRYVSGANLPGRELADNDEVAITPLILGG